jgi:lipopolysaccharide transport system permease protein
MKTFINSATTSSLNLKEILRFRTLARNFAQRDFTLRYKQTWIGLAWGILKPLMNIVIFGIISQFIDKSQSAAQSFINVSSGVIIWQLISAGMADVSNSLVANAGIMSKVYFPKIILPISSLMVTLIDFVISFSIFIIVFIIVSGFPGWHIILLPVFIFLALLLSLGAGILFATLNVKHRDVNFVLPFILQVAFYASPVFLKTQFFLQLNISPVLKNLFLINPTTSIIDGFRFCLLGTPVTYPLFFFAVSIAINFIIFFIGIRYFLKFEKTFADYI